MYDILSTTSDPSINVFQLPISHHGRHYDLWVERFVGLSLWLRPKGVRSPSCLSGGHPVVARKQEEVGQEQEEKENGERGGKV